MAKLKNQFSDSSRTFERIQKCLIEHRAKHIAYEYNDDGRIIGLAFGLEINGQVAKVKLPARIENVERILNAYSASQKEQAYRTAWANIRDWIEAQLALVDTEMVKMEEVLLPYVVIGNETVFEKLDRNQFQLGAGK